MVSARRPGRLLIALAGACAGLQLLQLCFVPGPQVAPSPSTDAAQFNPTVAASAVLPALTMLADDAEAKYGDYRRWSSVLVPLSTLVFPAVGFGAFTLYLFSEDFAFQLIPGSKEGQRRAALWDANPRTAQENPMDGLINPDDYEKGLEEAWERAKPKGSTVTVKDKLKQWSSQNNPHFWRNKLSA